MFTQTLSIARNAFIESVRQPIYFFMVLLMGLALVLTVWGSNFAMGYTTAAEVHGDNKLLLEIGLASVFVGGLLLAAFTATAVLSREIENKTVLTVVSKPIGRPLVVIGKYLGVAGALLVAITIALIVLLLGIRHGVLTTAADDPDGPVLVFGLAAAFFAIALGAATNYLYGWHFSQTAMLAMLPLMVVAYTLVLFIGKNWNLQSPGKDILPQVLIACAGQGLAILVLAALATAVSTRLGQVMTIVICAGVFVAGLLANHLVGRHAFPTTAIATVQEVSFERDEFRSFNQTGQSVNIRLDRSPSRAVRPGMSIYYGPSPNGFPMVTGSLPAFAGDVANDKDVFGPGTPGMLVASQASDRDVTLRLIGERAPELSRPPVVGDFVFLESARISALPLALWGVVPNMHFFWLVDAVSQNKPIPATHMVLVGLYSVVQVVGFLALGVLLFQKRDVG